MSYTEYKEVRAPQEIQDRWASLKANSTQEKPVTLGEAGVITWLSELSKEGGWRVVWQFFFFPIVLLEREVEYVATLGPKIEKEEDEK